jgi:Na+/proline symporter
MENFAENLYDGEDDLKTLVREKGLLTASPDLAQRIMATVEEDKKKADRTHYTPLLSRKAWIFLITSVSLLLLLCWLIISNEDQEGTYYSGALRAALDTMRSFDYSIHLNINGLLIATIVIASIGLLLCLDILISRKYKEASV